MQKIFTTPFASLSLERYPTDSHPSLQAFDAADEYLLNQLAGLSIPHNKKLLIMNDSFGALTCNLAARYRVDTYSDSYLAQLALNNNLNNHSIPNSSVHFIPSTHPLSHYYDVVLIKIPKLLALFEEQLIQLQPYINQHTIVLAAGMIKHLPKAATELLEKYIGSVTPTLAVKKARLLEVTPESRPFARSPYPTTYQVSELNLSLTNHANVFCRESLDIGTRVLLPHLTYQPSFKRVADLGCGNGVIGITCALRNPQAELIFVDESYMAIASTKLNWQNIFPDRPATTQVSDGLINHPKDSLDCVLCNPPFHQQQVIGDFIARRMFKQAKHSLKSGGELWIVANRHLNYYQLLKQLFKQVTVSAQTNKFVLLKAIK